MAGTGGVVNVVSVVGVSSPKVSSADILHALRDDGGLWMPNGLTPPNPCRPMLSACPWTMSPETGASAT